MRGLLIAVFVALAQSAALAQSYDEPLDSNHYSPSGSGRYSPSPLWTGPGHASFYNWGGRPPGTPIDRPRLTNTPLFSPERARSSFSLHPADTRPKTYGQGYGTGYTPNYFGATGNGYGLNYSHSYFGNPGQLYGTGYGPKY